MSKHGQKTIRVTKEAQAHILTYVNSVLVAKANFSEFTNKLRVIDEAYATYVSKHAADVNAAKESGNPTKAVPVPLIASLVESFAGYIAEVYLSGYPLFPVASLPNQRQTAEQLEAVLDSHAVSGRYPRHLAMFGRDAAKYNFAALEVIWDSVPTVAQTQLDNPAKLNNPNEPASISYNREWLNVVKRLCPYNTLWDYRVPMADVATEGDYAGHIELYSRKRLKRLVNKLGETDDHLNAKEVFTAVRSGQSSYFVTPPQVSDYVSSTAYQNGQTWEDWLGIQKTPRSGNGDLYEVTTLYARVVPKELGLKSPRPNSPQIWKFIVVDQTTLIHAAPLHNARDMLPILIGSPIEDGLNYQTKSLAEAIIPLQGTLADLFNIRISSAKRAINDRMLYDPSMIDPDDINSSAPAAKIPIKQLRMGQKLSDAVQALPFDAAGTATVTQDINQTIQMAYLASGQNPTRQGQFHKGNRTKAEFDVTMSFSDMRSRLLTIALEHQVFVPLKEMLKHNILLHMKDTELLSRATNQVVKLNVSELRKAILEFKIADGFTPSSKMASVETLQVAMQFAAQNPEINAQFDVVGMFTHLMSLNGVKGLDQYRRQPDPAMQQGQPPAQQPGTPPQAGQPPQGATQ